jgi:tetratricopeptide (TPR) repeat protein
MDELQALMDNGQYAIALERARSMVATVPQAAVIGAAAAINLGDSLTARAFLDGVEPLHDPALESERLYLLGVLHQQDGDQEGYQRLARQAVAVHTSFNSLLHLAMSLPQEEAILTLKEALARARTPQEEGQAAYALARALEKLGRFRDGASYASLALLRDPTNPIFFLAYASLSLAGTDEALPLDFIPRLKSIALYEVFGIQILALHILADALMALGRTDEALVTCQDLLDSVGKDLLPLFAWQAVRIHLKLGQLDLALQRAQAAMVSDNPDPHVKGMANLAMGQALFPRLEATGYFAQAHQLLFPIAAAPALIAQAFLARLQNQPLCEQDATLLLTQWSRITRNLLPEPVKPTGGIQLQTLGKAELTGPQGQIALRPRGLELLVLLLDRPEGYHWDDLSIAMYGDRRSSALKAEVFRLRQALGDGIASRPWRIEQKGITADFLEIRYRLTHGNLMGALVLWRGSFMPGSKAPAIDELRHSLEEELRQAVLASQNTAALFKLIEYFPEDLELAEALLEQLDESDYRYYGVAAMVRRLRPGYESSGSPPTR